jgi:hypothetical protein
MDELNVILEIKIFIVIFVNFNLKHFVDGTVMAALLVS